MTTYSKSNPIAVKSNKSLTNLMITIIIIPLNSMVNLTLFLMLFNIKYNPAHTRQTSIISFIIVKILSIVINPPNTLLFFFITHQDYIIFISYFKNKFN